MRIIFTFLLLLHFTFSFSQWTRVQQLPATDIFSLYQKNNLLYAGGVNIIYFSTNNGQTWDSTSLIPQLARVDNIVLYKGELYASSFGLGVYKSPDGGITWKNINAGSGNVISDFAEWKGDLYAATEGNSAVKLEPVQRNSWLPFSNGLSSLSVNLTSIIGTSTTLIAGSLANGLYDYLPGNTSVWEERFFLGQISPSEGTDDIVTAHDSLFLSGSTGKFYLSTDNGLNWTRFGNNSLAQNTLLVNSKQAFIAARNIFDGQFENTFFAYAKKDSLAQPFVQFSSVLNHFSNKIEISGGKLWDASSNGLFYMSLSDLPGISEADDSTIVVTLPLRFISFDIGLKNDASVSVEWKTADELNIDHFEVERSPDGISWKHLANTFPKVSHVYSYSDKSPQAGQDYYRIKAIDRDGKFYYSAIKSLLIQDEIKFLTWPNPVNEKIYIQLVAPQASQAIINLFDSRGALVRSEKATVTQGNNQLSIDIRSLVSGAYSLFINWNNGQMKKAVQVIKQ